MSLRPSTFEEAKQSFKPMSRSPMKRGGAIARKPKKKKVKVSTTKNKVWIQFSIYIRTRGANADGMNHCVTCWAIKHWKELQAGHFIAGRLNSNLFDERGCHPQCSLCNVVKAGNGPRYYQFMLKTYGQEVIDELLTKNDQTKKWLPGELESLLEKYSSLNNHNPLLST